MAFCHRLALERQQSDHLCLVCKENKFDKFRNYQMAEMALKITYVSASLVLLNPIPGNGYIEVISKINHFSA